MTISDENSSETDETINTTDNHPFYVEGKGWVAAIELEEGDILRTANGEVKIVKDVTIEYLDEPELIYNLEVEGYHTYFVSDENVLVHNDCGSGDGSGDGGSKANVVDSDTSKLSISQKKAIASARNSINDHLKDSDLSGALMELQGNPIPKANGGYWNHIQEVKDAYVGLVRAKGTLSGSLKNPNLASDVRDFIQGEYDTISSYINTIEVICTIWRN